MAKLSGKREAYMPIDMQEDGKYLVVTIANVSGDTYIDNTTGNRINCDYKNPYVLRKNDILISLTGNVGKVSKMTDEPAVLNQRVAKLNIISEKISKDLLFHILHSERFERAMIDAGQGAAQKNIRRRYRRPAQQTPCPEPGQEPGPVSYRA